MNVIKNMSKSLLHALMVLVLVLASSSNAKTGPSDTRIIMKEATWGYNCHGSSKKIWWEIPAFWSDETYKIKSNNVLLEARKNCDGKSNCRLQASEKVFGFDPAPWCHKELRITFRCLWSERTFTVTAGHNQPVNFSCRKQ